MDDRQVMLTLISLFFAALAAATILPFSSELMLLGALQAGEVPASYLIAAATLGNIAGALINWGLGRYLIDRAGHPWFPFSAQQVERATQRFNRYGVWTLFFSFLPVIGDPLTLVAGALKVPLLPFIALVSLGKATRYALIGWAA